MNTFPITRLILSSALLLPLAAGLACSDNDHRGGSREISHTDSEKAGWFGGRTREVNTVYKNDDGSTSVETETTTTNGNNVTITRERKTTDVNGRVKTDRETRKVVKGSEDVKRESTSR